MKQDTLAKNELGSMRDLFDNLKNKNATQHDLEECEAKYTDTQACMIQ